MLEKSRKDKPGYVRHSEADLDNAASTRTSQMRTLMSVDDLVADVLTEMGNLEELDNTLAVFMSDNGFLWAEHGMLGPTASKSNPYTASIKIPLSLRWPGHILEGGIDSRQVSIVDLLPTILEATGVAPDPTYPLDGSSLLQTDWSRSRIFTEYQHTPKTKTPSWASIRTPEYQYIETYGWGDIGTSPEVYGDSDDEVIQFREYYYLKSDRWQNHNVLADKRLKNDPDVASLHRMLTRDRRCKGSTCP
jgi:arylsulfatase A-like enzyme